MMVALTARLAALGASVSASPLVTVKPVDGAMRRIRDALRDASARDWIAITSGRAIQSLPVSEVLSSGIRVACVGPTTSAALKESGLNVALVASPPTGEGLAASMIAAGVADRSVILPRSDLAQRSLPAKLTQAGARVVEIVAYQTKPDASLALKMVAELRSRASFDQRASIIVLASPSAVSSFVAAAGRSFRTPGLSFVAIGPTTAAALRSASLAPVAVAEEPTEDGLFTACLAAMDAA